MKKTLFAVSLIVSCSAFGQASFPEELPKEYRPGKVGEEDMPTELLRHDFFGNVDVQGLRFEDPFDGPRLFEGEDPSLNVLSEGFADEIEELERNVSTTIPMEWGGMPVVPVTIGQAVSVLLMRDGQVLQPGAVGDMVFPADLIDVITMKGSPWIYLVVKDGAVFPGNYPFTNIFIPFEADGKPASFQMRLKAVEPGSESFMPIVKLDMMSGDFPVYYGQKSQSVMAANSDAVSSYRMGQGGGRVLSSKMDRQELQLYFPTMVDMAKSYDDAVRDRVDGYGTDTIIQRRPSSFFNGKVVVGGSKIPAFRNEYDGQLYFVPFVYDFPSPDYDALLYKVVVKNNGNEPIDWNYGLMKIAFGSQPKSQAERVSVAAPDPEGGEVCLPGETMTLWLLVQGRGIDGRAPIRMVFPPRERDGYSVPVETRSERPVRKDPFEEGALEVLNIN